MYVIAHMSVIHSSNLLSEEDIGRLGYHMIT